jgi:hypothetical protein
LSAENGAVVVRNLLDEESLLCLFEKLHVCAPAFLETEVNCSSRAELEEIFQCSHEQRKGGFEIYAVRGKDYIRLVINNLFWERLAPADGDFLSMGPVCARKEGGLPVQNQRLSLSV